MREYLYVSVKQWDRAAFERRALPGWHYAANAAEIEAALNRDLRYIFFKHWSERVPDRILLSAECVCFHSSDVPYGRGGSPIQNLIALGHKETKLTALRMIEELDAGPVYLKRPVSLAGSAQEIFERMADLSLDMAVEIAEREITPVEQTGEVTVFRRRTPAQSEITGEEDIEKIYDTIRMLDADTYPRAFIRLGRHRALLTNARLEDGKLTAGIEIKED